MTFAEFVKNLRTLKIKKKGMRPKVNPNKFYPYQADLQTEEALRDELKDYANRLEIAAGNGGVQAVYAVPGAVPEDFEPKVRHLAELVDSVTAHGLGSREESSLYFPVHREHLIKLRNRGPETQRSWQ